MKSFIAVLCFPSNLSIYSGREKVDLLAEGDTIIIRDSSHRVLPIDDR